MSFLNKPLHWLLRKLEKVFDGTDAIAGINFGDETFDAYEHAQPFTPYFYGSSTSGDYDYTTQFGFYGLWGKFCWYNIRLVTSVQNTAPNGSIRIGGLPFTVATSHIVPAAVSNVSRINFSNQISADAWSGATYVALLKLTAGTSSTAAFIQHSDLGTLPAIRVAGVYQIA